MTVSMCRRSVFLALGLLTAFEHNVKQGYSDECEDYYAEIIGVVTGIEFASAYIAHYSKIDQQQKRQEWNVSCGCFLFGFWFYGYFIW